MKTPECPQEFYAAVVRLCKEARRPHMASALAINCATLDEVVKVLFDSVCAEQTAHPERFRNATKIAAPSPAPVASKPVAPTNRIIGPTMTAKRTGLIDLSTVQPLIDDLSRRGVIVQGVSMTSGPCDSDAACGII